jgi:serine/threonine protein kinase
MFFTPKQYLLINLIKPNSQYIIQRSTVLSLCLQPERIDPQGNPSQYDVRSDVWSFGISMIEISTGRFPYETWRTPFEQLRQVGFEPSTLLLKRPETGPFNNFFPLLFLSHFKRFETSDLVAWSSGIVFA